MYTPNKDNVEKSPTKKDNKTGLVECLEDIIEDCQEMKANLTDIFQSQNPISMKKLADKQKRDKFCRVLSKRN